MTHYNQEFTRLKESLLTMASHAESAVSRAMRSLIERDDILARKVEDDDNLLDQLEIEIDDIAIHLLAKAPLATELRLITVAMKISHNLERVGDEAVTIARRSVDLNTEPQLKPYIDLPRMATMSVEMLRRSGTRGGAARLGSGRSQPPASSGAFQLHGGAAHDDFPVPAPDGDFEIAGTNRRPRDERGGGGRLPLRGERHPTRRSKTE
jgi:hypothetical protein